MKNKKITAFDLKIIAIVAMLIDHIGHIFIAYPISIPFRIIGRLTAPIMAFLIVEGYHYTKSVNKYMARLFIFALISQIPYMMIIGSSMNILFTYLIALMILESFHKIEDKLISMSLIIFLLTISVITEYGIWGILFIVIFHMFRNERKKQLLYFSLLTIIRCTYLCITMDLFNLIQFAALLVIPLIILYNNKRGKSLKYFFYVFYPAHLLILWIIKTLTEVIK